MANASPYFWMGNRAASDLIEITDDPARLDDGGFWAVCASFDGRYQFAKFANVVEAPWNFSYQPIRHLEWKSSHGEVEYCKLVEKIRAEIAAGNVYQVNACRRLDAKSDASLKGLVAGFLNNNPAKFLGYLSIPGLEIASASPENFLTRRGDIITTSPIKGTRAPSKGRFPKKDEAENIMIVDLMRNDLSKICVDGSITTPRLLEIEALPGLDHLVSDVSGVLRSGISWKEIFKATLPPGSVSGAPKSSAIKIINEFELIDRGPYCGTFGWIEGERAELAVAIRTFWSDGNIISFGTGAGITWASDPHREWQETELKAKRLIAIATGTFKEPEGIFETIRVEDNQLFALHRHHCRAEESARQLGFEIPTEAEVAAKTEAFLSNKKIALGRLRWQFGRDGEFNITVEPYVQPSPAKVMTFDFRNSDFNLRYKTYPYRNLELLDVAKSHGFDDGIMVAPDGQFTESSVASLMVKIKGVWITPPLSSGILNGVVRALVIEGGLAKVGKVYDIDEIESAILLSGLRLAQPVASINGRELIIDEAKVREIHQLMATFKGK